MIIFISIRSFSDSRALRGMKWHTGTTPQRLQSRFLSLRRISSVI